FVEKRGLAGVPSDTDGKGKHPRLNRDRLNELKNNPVAADANAHYAKELSLDLSTVTPHVSGPNHVKVMTPVSQMGDVKVHKAYLVSCVNSRVQDLADAAEVVRGKKVAEGVKFYIAAASSEVQAESERRGDWQALLAAGAIELPPGCGPCIGLGTGLLEDGEVGISATNRNFKGRMGSKNAEAYLASPAVVAASAITGSVAMPFEMEASKIVASIRTADKVKSGADSVAIIDGFPAAIEGDVIFCHLDNLNTDGIYPGKYTYIDDFTAEQQAGVVMENYDPEFGKLVKDGDILVGGFNFGTGSSREQAATALKYRGIRLVLAGSFSETYKRNALNNGFLAIEAPELVKDLKDKFGNNKLSVATGSKARIDFTSSQLQFDGQTYSISPVGAAAQELIVTDGLENWVKGNL
ncbi:MAG: homoaconitase, partial [Candidatus Zixiibacteriota bacterium]